MWNLSYSEILFICISIFTVVIVILLFICQLIKDNLEKRQLIQLAITKSLYGDAVSVPNEPPKKDKNGYWICGECGDPCIPKPKYWYGIAKPIEKNEPLCNNCAKRILD